MSRRFVDLSHTIEHGMVTYPGIPGPDLTDHLTREASRGHYAPGTEFQIGRISLVANTGTYLDTPFHRYEGGSDLAAVPLDAVAGLRLVVVDAGRAGSPAIGAGAMMRHVPSARSNAAPASERCPSRSKPPHTIISVPDQTTAGSDRSLIGAGGSSTVEPGGMSLYNSASPRTRSSNASSRGE